MTDNQVRSAIQWTTLNPAPFNTVSRFNQPLWLAQNLYEVLNSGYYCKTFVNTATFDSDLIFKKLLPNLPRLYLLRLIQSAAYYSHFWLAQGGWFKYYQRGLLYIGSFFTFLFSRQNLASYCYFLFYLCEK